MTAWADRRAYVEHRLTELEREKARLEGRMEGLRDRARSDPELREALRVRSWARTAPGRVVAERAGEVLRAPEGWPDGTDGDAEVEAYLRDAFGS